MQKKSKSGFTLIELLVVVLIVGILSAVALPQNSTAVEKSRATEALALMDAVAGAAERYYFQKEAWPESIAQLDIEVPSYYLSGIRYGGKNFQIRMETFDEDGSLHIQALRRPSLYTLETVLKDDGETITRRRTCQKDGNNAKGETYCNAITNGHNDEF